MSAPSVEVRRIGMLGRFLIYGVCGWAVEVLFTAIIDRVTGQTDNAMVGKSYLWMFPIWGTGVLACERFGVWLKKKRIHFLLRGLAYVPICFLTEASFGLALYFILGKCPWDYSRSEWALLHGTIRLDYAPFWAVCGWCGEPIALWLRRLRVHRYDADDEPEP